MKKTNITLSIALAAVFSASTAFAEAEVSGKIVHESAKFTTSGTTIGAATAHGKDAFKQETSARIYIDGEVNDDATYHVELNLMKDGKAGANYDGSESYTQRDALREAYVDTQQGDWAIRAGKQQVVWGTADGMKLLDMINPSDYGEMAQNQMEDSRIPVWMINAEKTNEDGSEFQVVVSQPKENVFAGLNRNTNTAVRQNQAGTGADLDMGIDNGTDTGHAFMMKGPDTITGTKDGFLNITPDLGGVATMFAGGFGGLAELGLYSMSGFTVGGFETMAMGGTSTSMSAAMNHNQMLAASGDSATGNHVTNTDYTANSNTMDYLILPDNFQQSVMNTGAWMVGKGMLDSTSTSDLNSITGAQMLQFGFASQFDTNLADAEVAGEAIDTAFDYMGNTTFFTFDSFVNAGSQYVYNMPTNSEFDLAARHKATTKNGVNYSLNASYNYDKNPIINLSWRNATGDLLHVNKVVMQTVDNEGVTPTGNMQVMSSASASTPGGYSLSLADTVLTDGTTMTHSAYGGRAQGMNSGAILRFEQEVKRVVNVGGSFDMAVETESLGPVVIRGEALYTKGAYSPVIDKSKLSYGDLVGALEMVKGDRMKFVLGADITALTNMMVSAQFIQDSDLDFVEGTDRYTADYATMHMSNGFNKGTKDKNFYSLFFSKPFGESGQHRWNNITMYEENGGKWNRFDIDYSIDDDTQATVEYNKYWGNENTQFGQLEASSNIQVGVKYSF